MSEEVEEGPNPSRRLLYIGKFKLSFRLTGWPPIFMVVPKNAIDVAFTTTESEASVFAIYNIEGQEGQLIQYIPPADGTMPSACVGFAKDADDYAIARAIGHPQDIRLLKCTVGDKSVRIFDPAYQRYVGLSAVGGPVRFYMPELAKFWDPWDAVVIHRWSGGPWTKPDLRWVMLSNRGIHNVDLTGADLRNATFGSSSLGSVNLTDVVCNAGTSFSNTNLMPGCEFKGATVKDVLFTGTNATLCGFTGLDFTGAKFLHGSGKSASFIECDFKDATFSGCDLTGVDFTRSKLAGAKFVGCTLKDANFTSAELKGATFKSATLGGAKFTSATLTAASFESAAFGTAAAPTTVDFTGAKMVGIDFSNCDLTYGRFSADVTWYTDASKAPDKDNPLTRMKNATVPLALIGTKDWTWLDLEGAKIDRLPATLEGFKAHYTVFPKAINFAGLVLDDADFLYATLEEADFSGAKCKSDHPPKFQHANLRRAKMTKAKLNHADFQYAEMAGIKLVESDLAYALFNNARLGTEGNHPSDLSLALLLDTDFTGAFLGSTGEGVGANFASAIITGDTKFDNATLPKAQFPGAYLAGVSFQNVQGKAMQSVSFAGACLVNCKFNGATLAFVTLTGAALQGADFTDADLSGALVGNAAVAITAGTITITGLPPDLYIDSLDYDPTKVESAKTDDATTCPSSDHGPCSGSKWISEKGPMTEWRYGSKRVTDNG